MPTHLVKLHCQCIRLVSDSARMTGMCHERTRTLWISINPLDGILQRTDGRELDVAFGAVRRSFAFLGDKVANLSGLVPI